jgi:N-acetylmuramoyl-L-alanine amidase CwlA
MIEDISIPNDVWEAALKVSHYATMQGWNGDWCIADVCSRKSLDTLNKEIKKWKSNHDNQVKLKSILIQRPDLKDRANRMAKFIQENTELKTKLQELISSYERDIKEWENGNTFVENELDFYMQKGKMSKLRDIVDELKNLLPNASRTN